MTGILFADIEGVMYSGGAGTLVSMIGIYVWLVLTGRQTIIDSPWFWGAMFSGCALLGVLFIGPKYVRREAAFELKAIGRARAVPSAQPGLGTNAPMPQSPAGAQDFVAVDEQGEPLAPPTRLMVPLYALAGLFAAGFLFSISRLVRMIQTSPGDPA